MRALLMAYLILVAVVLGVTINSIKRTRTVVTSIEKQQKNIPGAQQKNGLPLFSPKIVTKLTSPDETHIAYTKAYITTQADDHGKLQTWGKHKDLYISDANGSNARALFIVDYRDRNRSDSCGIRYFSWSADSKWIVFDFIVEDIGTAYSDYDGRSIIGIVNVETGKGQLLEDKGCEPNFADRRNNTVKFISFDRELLHHTIGTGYLRSEKGKIYYAHTLKFGEPPSEAFSFRSNIRKDLTAFEREQ